MVYLSLFVVSLVSGCLIFIKSLDLKARISSLLSFSGAYLLGICFLHLIPELFEHNHTSVGIYLLIGFFLQVILDYFSGGIEHGHVHVNQKRLGKFPLLIFIGLGLHAFLESFPLLELEQESYLIGLLVHKVPIAIILGGLLLGYQLNRKLILLGIILFSLMGPLGAFTGSYFQADTVIFQKFLAISIGIILHLSTTILLETNEQHRVSVKKLIPLLSGIVLALLSLVAH